MRVSDWSSDVCSSDLAAQDQPGFVAVPDGGNRIHRRVALRAAAEHRKQDADAEVEAVHHDIGEDGEGDDAGPYGRQVEIAHVYCPPQSTIRSGRLNLIGESCSSFNKVERDSPIEPSGSIGSDRKST